MVKLKIYDAAGPTRSFLYEETAQVPVAISPGRFVSEATVLDGRFEGETVRGELIGRFDLATGEGEIEVMRQLLDGERHFEVAFQEPVALDRIEEDLAEAFAGPIEFVGNRFANFLFGADGGDRLSGGGGTDRLGSGGGEDLLRGGRGADRLSGGAGDDRLVGGRGDDRLLGGRGRDELTGGAGADAFEFRTARGANDVVADFEAGLDVVDLSGIDARADRSGDQSFRFVGEAAFSGRSGELRFADGLLRGDVDGDGADDLVVALSGLEALGADDLLL